MPYPDDPALRRRTLALLGRIWTKLGGAVDRARGWGADWCELSTPFLETDDAGSILAHVGIIPLPMLIDGRQLRFAGIHAVCTEAAQRGRGLMRAAMTRALAHADAHYDGAVLWANDPAIYHRFGFVERGESIFVGPVRGGTGELRPLALERPEDLALLQNLLARRAPVSQRCDVIDSAALTLIDLALWQPGPSLAYLPDLDCVVSYAVRERFVDLYDVIAPGPVALAELAARLGEAIDTAVVYFSPDGLDAPQLRPEPTVLIDPLMVRGPWCEEPFAVAPLRRC